MDFLKKNKLVTGLATLAILALVYFAISSAGASPSLSATDPSVQSPVSQNLLVTLANLHTIRLDGNIFSNPTFVSLTDFGVAIAPPASIGRGNPFAAAAGTTGAPKNPQVIVPTLHH